MKRSDSDRFFNVAASALAASVASGDSAADPSLPVPKGRFLSLTVETYNVDEHQHGEAQPQLQVSPITMLKTDFRLEYLNQIAVNQHYICYGLKQGHIRVINKHTATRALLKGHTTMVSDMQFFQPSSNLLASTAKGCDIYVRSITEDDSGIHDQVLLKIPLKDADTTSSLCWHPSSSQLLVCSVGAAISFVQVPDPQVPNANPATVTVPVLPHASGLVTSLSFSADGQRLAAGTSTGLVKVWVAPSDVSTMSPELTPLASFAPFAAVGKVDFLPTGHLVVGDPYNEVIKLWAVQLGGESQLLQTLSFKANTQDAFFNHLCIQPAHNLLVVANSRRTQLITVHYSTGPEGDVSFDYVAEFSVAMPILSMTVPKDLEHSSPDTFTLYCIQTEAIQQYTVYARSCKPPPRPAVPRASPAIAAAPTPTPADENGAAVEAAAASPTSTPASIPTADAETLSMSSPVMPPDPVHLTGLLTPSLLIKRASSGAHSPGVGAVLASASSPAAPPSPSLPPPPAPGPFAPDLLTTPVHTAPVPVAPPAATIPVPVVPAPLPTLPADVPGSPLEADLMPEPAPVVPEALPPPAVPEPPRAMAAHGMSAAAAAAGAAFAAAAQAADEAAAALSREQTASSASSVSPRKKPPLTMSEEVVVAAVQQTAPVDPAATAPTQSAPEPAEAPPAAPAAFPEPASNGPVSQEAGTRTVSSASAASGFLMSAEGAAPAVAQRVVPRAVPEPSASSSSAATVGATVAPAVAAAPQVVVDAGAMAAELDAVKAALAKVLAAQQEMKAELASSQRAVTSSLRDEVRQGFNRSRGELGDTLGRVLEERLSAPLRRSEDERRKAATTDRKEMQRTLEQLVNSMGTTLQAGLAEMLAQHATSLFAGVSASVDMAVQTSVQAALTSILPTELAGRPLQLALQNALAVQLREALHQPLASGLRSCLSESLLPSFERATQSMFAQIELHFGSGLAEQLRTAAGGGEQLAGALRNTLQQAQAVTNGMQSAASSFQTNMGSFQSSVGAFQSSVGSFQASMSEAVQQVSSAAAAAAAAVSAAPARTDQAAPTAQPMTLSQLEAAQDPKQLIRGLIAQGKWEDAFLKALSLEDVDSVAWLCKQTDASGLLGSTPCPLSQIVLLPLVQQLGHDLSKDAEIKVRWILEAANYIDPRHPTIAPYAPSILKQARDNLNAAMVSSQGELSRLCRTATHVVNSLLHQ